MPIMTDGKVKFYFIISNRLLAISYWLKANSQQLKAKGYFFPKKCNNNI